MTGVSVALVSCSGILGDLIRAELVGRSDIAIVEDSTTDDLGDLSAELHRAAPRVVVWQLEDDAILVDRPELFGAANRFAVVAIVADGRCGAVWKLRPQRMALGQLSTQSLVATIHAAAAAP